MKTNNAMLNCVRWFWKWIIFIHTLQCRWKLFTSKTNVCNIQHSVVRFHIVCGHFVIILCLQIDRANLRFGQMAISEKLHRRLTYTNLGSSSPSSDLKLYWWTLTPTQVFFRICDDDAVQVQFLEAACTYGYNNNNSIVKYTYSTKIALSKATKAKIHQIL